MLDPEASLADVRTALDQLREAYDFDQHAVELVEMAGGFQLLTRPAFAQALERAQFTVRASRLDRRPRWRPWRSSPTASRWAAARSRKSAASRPAECCARCRSAA